MLAKLTTQEQAELLELSNFYLKSENPTKTSIEVVEISPLKLLYWVYAANSTTDGIQCEDNFITFIVSFLLKPMFKGNMFKFNGIMYKAFVKSEDNPGLVTMLMQSHIELQEKKKTTAKELAKKEKEKIESKSKTELTDV